MHHKSSTYQGNGGGLHHHKIKPWQCHKAKGGIVLSKKPKHDVEREGKGALLHLKTKPSTQIRSEGGHITTK